MAAPCRCNADSLRAHCCQLGSSTFCLAPRPEGAHRALHAAVRVLSNGSRLSPDRGHVLVSTLGGAQARHQSPDTKVPRHQGGSRLPSGVFPRADLGPGVDFLGGRPRKSRHRHQGRSGKMTDGSRDPPWRWGPLVSGPWCRGPWCRGPWCGGGRFAVAPSPDRLVVIAIAWARTCQGGRHPWLIGTRGAPDHERASGEQSAREVTGECMSRCAILWVSCAARSRQHQSWDGCRCQRGIS